MAPRNSDASTNYKKNFNVEETDANVKDIVPCLLHKKHKVVKLVKNQMQKIQQEGLLCGTSGLEIMEEEVDIESGGGGSGGRGSGAGVLGEGRRMRRSLGLESDASATSMDRNTRRAVACWSLLMLILTIFLLILLMVWIAAGPLSNSMAHTPIPGCSFVRTEGHCSLEKKYLLRWSKPEHFE